jgi:hypothetical protein
MADEGTRSLADEDILTTPADQHLTPGVSDVDEEDADGDTDGTDTTDSSDTDGADL